jgi:hypothetical protein
MARSSRQLSIQRVTNNLLTILRTCLGRFLSLTVNLLQNANPRRLKEVLQILASNIELLMSDDHLFTAVCDAALGSTDCDYFLLKVDIIQSVLKLDYFQIARAEFFAKIRWNYLSPQITSTYQSLCLSNFCRQCFDSDFRVVKSTMDSLKRFTLHNV